MLRLVVYFFVSAALFLTILPRSVGAPLWVDLYYPGWIQQNVPPSAINFSKITIVDNFAITPNPDGSLNTAANNVDDKAAADLILKAHQANRKVLITLGGETTGD